MLQLYEEEDDASSPLKGPAVLKPETDVQSLNPCNLPVVPEVRAISLREIVNMEKYLLLFLALSLFKKKKTVVKHYFSEKKGN